MRWRRTGSMWGRAECVQRWTSQSKSLVFHRGKTQRTKPTVQTKTGIRPRWRIELLASEGNLHRIWMQCHFTRSRYAWLKTALYRLIAHFGKEWKPGTRTRRARIYQIIWGDTNVNKHGGKRTAMFHRVKTAESSKTEGEIEKKKHKNVKLTEDVPGAILPREKPEECTVCYCTSNSN